VDQQPFSLMTGKVIDQSALYGVLARMRDLGVDLISLQPEPHSEVPGSSPVDLSSSLDKSQKHQQHKKSDKQQQ